MDAFGKSSTRFSLALDEFDGDSVTEKVLTAAMRGASGMCRPTEWEVFQLFQGQRLADTTLYLAGKVVDNPWAP